MSPKNSKKSSKKLPLFSCPNPDCPVRYRSFDTIKGYQNHLTHYPVCTAYAYTRHPFLTAIDGKHTQPIAMATVPTVAYAQEILNDSWNSSTLYTGNARVTQHARLPQPWIPTWVHSYQIIKTLQSLVTLKKLQSTTMNPSLRRLPCHPVLMLLRLQRLGNCQEVVVQIQFPNGMQPLEDTVFQVPCGSLPWSLHGGDDQTLPWAIRYAICLLPISHWP